MNATSINNDTKDYIILQLSLTSGYLEKNSSNQIIEAVIKVIEKTVDVLESVRISENYQADDVQNSIKIVNSILNFPDEVFNIQKTVSTK